MVALRAHLTQALQDVLPLVCMLRQGCVHLQLESMDRVHGECCLSLVPTCCYLLAGDGAAHCTRWWPPQ
jgi:hypothetical protein